MKFKNIKKKKYKKSPSNSRSIPASVKTSAGKAKHSKFWPKIGSAGLLKFYRVALKIFVVIIFILTSIIVGFDLQRNMQIKENIDFQRKILTNELSYWQDFIAKYQNYPDAYFQAASLEYRLGDNSKAKMYVEKGLALDPNSKNGRKIESLLK